MTRKIPDELYEAVLSLVTEIVQPFSDPIERTDESISRIAFGKLRALYEQRSSEHAADPFLTESLADVTDDAMDAVRLYREAIELSQAFPGEVVHSKRVGMSRRLLDIGERSAAREQLALAHAEALTAGDGDIMEEIDELRRELEP